MQTSIKQCLVNRRLSSGKTQLKQTQFHLSSPFNRLRLESHSFSQDHNELEHLYKCSSLILWSDLATSPSGFPTTLPLIPVSPETLAFWPWCMPAVFPRQMFCFPVPSLYCCPHRHARVWLHVSDIMSLPHSPFPTILCKNSISSPDPWDSPPPYSVLLCFCNTYHYLTIYV